MEPIKLKQTEIKAHPELLKAIEKGVPVSRAVFHQAVNNGQDVPENEFTESSQRASKRVMMWQTKESEFGLVCLHAGVFFSVPSANVIFRVFKKYE